jgi:uncharacterized protein involved in response to NO
MLAAHTVFFPAAAAYAILVLPAAVVSMTGEATLLPGLATPSRHAHEMLFGFALAVLAGHQLGPSALPRLAALLGLWAAARTLSLFAPQTIAAGAANAAFAVWLAALLAPRLLGAAKKLRNRSLPIVLAAICASSVAFQIASRASSDAAERTVLTVAVMLFAWLMLFMGGRLIAPAVAGQLYRQGAPLDARVQPRIEAGLIFAMAVAVAAASAGGPWLEGLAALAMAAAGLLAAVRLARWRLWALRGRPDLLCLAAGYAWLAIGLVLYGAALATRRHEAAALHVIAVGSLGTLTLNVMAMMSQLKARRDPARARLPVWGTVLIAVATLARALADFAGPDPRAMLLLAALCWSGAFALLLILLLRTPRRA